MKRNAARRAHNRNVRKGRLPVPKAVMTVEAYDKASSIFQREMYAQPIMSVDSILAAKERRSLAAKRAAETRRQNKLKALDTP